MLRNISKFILGFIILCLAYGIVESKEVSLMWAKCVYNEKILPCKLVDDRVVINGKDMNVSKLDVISLDGLVYVLLKEKQ